LQRSFIVLSVVVIVLLRVLEAFPLFLVHLYLLMVVCFRGWLVGRPRSVLVILLCLVLLLVFAALEVVDALDLLEFFLADLVELLEQAGTVNSLVKDEVISIFRAHFYAYGALFH